MIDGRTFLLDCVEAAMIASNATRLGSGRPLLTFERADEAEGPIVVHVEGEGKFQVSVDREH